MNEKLVSGMRSAIVAVMVIFGCWVYAEMKPQNFVTYETGVNQPDAAFDAILRGVLRTYGNSPQLKASAHPTETLRQTIKQLPRNDGILFIGEQKNTGHLALRLVTNTLAWPQPVYNPTCKDTVQGETPPDNFKASGAIYYHAVPPKNGATQKIFLPEMIVTTAPEQTAWNSFCPQ